MTSNHLSAMSKIAANIGKQPYVAPAVPDAPDNGQRAALRFAVGMSHTGEATCYWTIRYPDHTPNQHHTIYSFPLNGMGQDYFLKEIVKRSLNKLTAHNKDSIRVAVHQDNLREAFLKTTPNPLIHIINRESELANRLSTAAQDQLQQRITDEKTKRDEQTTANDRSKALKVSGTSTARTIYVDASFMPGVPEMGYGYVIKDVYNVPGGTGKRWELVYGAGVCTTSIAEGDNATGAELRAIRDVLMLPDVVNDDVRENHRSLFIATDSKWSVTILKALRDGQPVPELLIPSRNVPNRIVDAKEDWLAIAREITALLQSVETVTFQWVRGHNGDPLNEAADGLSRIARKNLEYETTDDKRLGFRNTIAAVMRNRLARQGIIAEVTEGSVSAERNC